MPSSKRDIKQGAQTLQNKSMNTRVAWYMALQNLQARRLRAGLTIAGIVIGIGSIHFLLTLGLGLQNLVTDEIIGSRSVKSIDVSSPNSSIIQITDATAEKITSLSNVETVARVHVGAGVIRNGGSETDTVVFGAGHNYGDIAGTTIVKGGWFGENDTADKILLNKAALEAIGEKLDTAVGKSLEISIKVESNDDESAKGVDKKVKIVGIVDSGTSSEIFVNPLLFSEAKADQYSQLKVVTRTVESVDEIREQIESLGLETVSPLDTITQIQQLFKYLNAILVAVGSIGMLVAVLGMFNTLTISLLERTREISLMITLGVKNSDIRKLFIYESLLLSVVGAVCGIVLATMIGTVVNVFMNYVAKSRGFNGSFVIFSTPWWLPGVSILSMVVVGLIVSYFPAKRAGKISPVDSLRDE